MIKGVNRQIVEIRNIDCPYFERIICYVRPEFSTESRQMLCSSAVNYIKYLTKEDAEKKPSKLPLWLVSAISAAGGVAACLIFMLVL